MLTGITWLSWGSSYYALMVLSHWSTFSPFGKRRRVTSDRQIYEIYWLAKMTHLSHSQLIGENKPSRAIQHMALGIQMTSFYHLTRWWRAENTWWGAGVTISTLATLSQKNKMKKIKFHSVKKGCYWWSCQSFFSNLKEYSLGYHCSVVNE